MTNNGKLLPDYIFEASWEVCNKVGGIYTVLSTRAKVMQTTFKDRVFFIGPYLDSENEKREFIEHPTLYAEWVKEASSKGLNVKIGRWNVPGNPIAILVDYKSFFKDKNSIYGQMWNDFHVDSLHGYGDYDDSSMFAYAVGKVIEDFYHYNLKDTDRVVFQAHEWMIGMGLLYIKRHVPQIATIFTTHATSIGRSIAGNGKALYAFFNGYNGDQMAQELNMQSKHSIEKTAAQNADCFTTVSEITNRECRQLLERPCDVILENGFENDFVPQGAANLKKARGRARKTLFHIANCLTGHQYKDEDTFVLSTSGRYEFRNKGIDVFLEALNRLQSVKNLKKKILAVIAVPAWVREYREDLRERLVSRKTYHTPLENPVITHWLNNMGQDNVLNALRRFGITNSSDSSVNVIFMPCYLDGEDGIVNRTYYQMLAGSDMTTFPSYYEPWGYTPLESIAFHIPCITTDLCGFGMWVNGVLKHEGTIHDGAVVVHRTDENYFDVADAIKEAVVEYASLEPHDVNVIRTKSSKLAEKALWKYFIKKYYAAYNFALNKAAKRMKI